MKNRHFASDLFDKKYDLIYEIIIESKSINNTKRKIANHLHLSKKKSTVLEYVI